MDASDAITWAENPELRLVLSTAPADGAEALAQDLVEAGVAACVNLVPGVRSVYRWKGQVANDPETLLLIKTTAEVLPALRDRLRERHTYEVPEIVALAAVGAAAEYAAWVVDSTASAGDSGSDETED